MAKDAKPAAAAEQGAEQAPKKSKKLLIIIVAAVLFLVLAGGGAAFFLLKKGDAEDDEEHAEEQHSKEKDKKKKKDPHAAPVFVAMEPFTVNLLPEGGSDQYLQVMMTVELEDAPSEAGLKGNLPKIRNNITLLLSSKKASELLTKDGKVALTEELKDEMNMVIDPPVKNRKGEFKVPDGPVKSVLFTSFIIQ